MGSKKKRYGIYCRIAGFTEPSSFWLQEVAGKPRTRSENLFFGRNLRLFVSLDEWFCVQRIWLSHKPRLMRNANINQSMNWRLSHAFPFSSGYETDKTEKILFRRCHKLA
ncbi:hypothetical protein ACMFMG_003602 [Clarireedia jacksonii]